MNNIFKTVFLLLTAIYLFSMTFDGVLIRQVVTVLFLAFSLLLFIFDKTYFSPGIIVGIAILIIIFSVSALLSPNDDWKLKVYFIFSGVAFLAFSYALYILDYKRYFFHFFVLACTLIIIRLLITHDENIIFFEASRNIVATFIIFPVVGSFLFTLQNRSLLPMAIITVFMCFLLKGRTALLISAAILCVALYKTFGLKGMVIVILLCSPFMMFIDVGSLNERIADNTNFSEGLKTTRSVIYNEYFSNFSLTDFVLGRSFNGMEIINILNNNPHNSFILIHSLFGFLPVLLLLILFLFVTLKTLVRYGAICALLFALIPIKAMTDSVIFFNLLDVFYMFPIMLLMNGKRTINSVGAKNEGY
ncbi:hypothetical protein ACAD20_000438 [Enterobacter ludwigii]